MDFTQNYIFHNRAVAFLDVLGFSQFLKQFDAEARENRQTIPEDESGADDVKGKYISLKANVFINTFKGAIRNLDSRKYRYYLFSDNICITSIGETTNEDLQDLLLVLSRLYFDFAQRGYFLRGGIDYGLFIDEETIAVGHPLVVAYELESKKAIYPRIILSQNIVDKFQTLNKEGEKVFDELFTGTLIGQSAEIKFLNVFSQVFQTDYEEERRLFFQNYHQVIRQHLEENKMNEHIYEKYKWLAVQFNLFIDQFTTELAFRDPDLDPENNEFLDFVKLQKIAYAN